MNNQILERVMDHIMGFLAGLIISVCLIFKYLIKSVFESIGTLARYTVLGFTTANNSRIEAKFMNPDNWDDGMF